MRRSSRHIEKLLNKSGQNDGNGKRHGEKQQEGVVAREEGE